MSTPTGDSLKRQSEINNWHYYSRLETLYIFQILFFGLSFLLFLSVLASYEIISPYFVGFFVVCMFVVLLLVWYFKNRYTSLTRDPKDWNKRKFNGDGQLSSNITAEMKQVLTQSAIAKCR
jgi:hypothetical protein